MLIEEKRSYAELNYPCEFCNRSCDNYIILFSEGLPFVKTRLILHKQLSTQTITNMLTQNCLLLENKVKQPRH